MTSIEQKCRVREKGTKIVTEELQQRIVAKSAKCERYEARCGKIRQDMLKNMNQKALFAGQVLGGNDTIPETKGYNSE